MTAEWMDFTGNMTACVEYAKKHRPPGWKTSTYKCTGYDDHNDRGADYGLFGDYVTEPSRLFTSRAHEGIHPWR